MTIPALHLAGDAFPVASLCSGGAPRPAVHEYVILRAPPRPAGGPQRSDFPDVRGLTGHESRPWALARGRAPTRQLSWRDRRRGRGRPPRRRERLARH